MSDLSIFSFFEDPELMNVTDTSSDWKTFFVSDMEDHLGPRQGTPDSGINFDIDTALVTDKDPVFPNFQGMKSADFQEEVDWMFNRPAAGVSAPATPPLNLSFSVSEDELDNIFSDNVVNPDHPSFYPLEDSEITRDVKPLITPESEPLITDIKEEVTTPFTEIHSYSAVPSTRRHKLQVTSRRERSAVVTPSRRRRRSSSPQHGRKRKLYEVAQPLDNPNAEKCRLNAINAKKNRDRKKHQLEQADNEIKRLRVENEELQNEAENARDELEDAREELARMKEAMKMAGLPVGKHGARKVRA